MTDRITTEEAERIADWLERGFPDQDDVTRTAAALRALAAERDGLLTERKGWIVVSNDAYRAGYAAGSGENQP